MTEPVPGGAQFPPGFNLSSQATVGDASQLLRSHCEQGTPAKGTAKLPLDTPGQALRVIG